MLKQPTWKESFFLAMSARKPSCVEIVYGIMCNKNIENFIKIGNETFSEQGVR